MRSVIFMVLLSGCWVDQAQRAAKDDVDGDGYPFHVDCEDERADIHPGAVELCDGIDNDCDGSVDMNAVDALAWYADTDGDGFGDPRVFALSCAQVKAHVADATDCNDDYNDVYPGAVEVCDDVDNDCDGETDESSAVDALTWYADADEDGAGDPSSVTEACRQPSGYVGNALDCDDRTPQVGPYQVEVCDDVDNDCDEQIDEEAADAPRWFADGDDDGLGNPLASTRSCTRPPGYVENPCGQPSDMGINLNGD